MPTFRVPTLLLKFYFLSSSCVISFLFSLDPTGPRIIKPKIPKNIPIGDNLVTATVGDNVTATLNTTIRIECPHTGVPNPQVQWSRNDGKSFDAVTNDNGTLILLANADSGKYICTVRNKDGEDSFSSQVDIVGKSEHFQGFEK